MNHAGPTVRILIYVTKQIFVRATKIVSSRNKCFSVTTIWVSVRDQMSQVMKKSKQQKL